MINAHAKAAASIVVVLSMLLGSLAIIPAASAETTSISDKLDTEDGPTDVLGGGDHFFIRFGWDAAFGVVWGTEDNPNNVYFVAIKTRYLGMAQVYDREGNLVSENNTIKIYTLYAVKLDDMLEFDDVNDNGILPYTRVYENGNFTGTYMAGEPLYKKVDMKTAWEASPITEEGDEEVRTWSFDLTARDLPYELLDSSAQTPVGDNVLNNLTLTFNLEARMVQVDNATMPQWRVTVTRGLMGNMWFFGAERIEDMVVSGKVITYHVKWDQSIKGWDYDEANANPALLMELEALVGNYIPAGMATWMEMRMISYMNEAGRMNYETPSGEATLNQTTNTYTSPRVVSSPRLSFGGEYTKIGRLEWVSNVTVDGEQDQLHAQIMAGVPIWAVGWRGDLFAGFACLAGLTFPGGDEIIHDPTFSSEALIDVDGGTIGKFLVLMIGFAAVLAVIAIIGIVVVAMGKKPAKKTPQTYERTFSSQPGEWAKYYDKK